MRIAARQSHTVRGAITGLETTEGRMEPTHPLVTGPPEPRGSAMPKSASGPHRVEIHASHIPPTSLGTLAVGVVTVAALYFGREVFVPMALAILLGFALAPLVLLLRRLALGPCALGNCSCRARLPDDRRDRRLRRQPACPPGRGASRIPNQHCTKDPIASGHDNQGGRCRPYLGDAEQS